MPLLRTDDGPRRLRAIWLGPNGATLPFEWTYVQCYADAKGEVVEGIIARAFADRDRADPR